VLLNKEADRTFLH